MASERHTAATPELLRALDSPAFRANLSALLPPGSSSVAALPAVELIARAEAEWNVAEVVHNFDPRPEPTSMSCLNCVDPDLAIARNTSYWVNDWEMLLLANTSDPPSTHPTPRPGWPTFAAGIVSGWLGGASIAESWVGHTAFTGRAFETGFDGWPASLAEAAQRPIYTVVNQRRSAAGATYFGSVGIVFNRTWARESTLIAALDTVSQFFPTAFAEKRKRRRLFLHFAPGLDSYQAADLPRHTS